MTDCRSVFFYPKARALQSSMAGILSIGGVLGFSGFYDNPSWARIAAVPLFLLCLYWFVRSWRIGIVVENGSVRTVNIFLTRSYRREDIDHAFVRWQGGVGTLMLQLHNGRAVTTEGVRGLYSWRRHGPGGNHPLSVMCEELNTALGVTSV